MQDAAPEHGPLSGIDEYLVHNYPLPQRVMYTSDPRAYERTWFTCQDQTGDLFVVTGEGFYPNLGTAEAYAIVNLRGRHIHVRAHRRLGDNRMNMRVGPVDFAVMQPFKEWRLTLGHNPHDIEYDLRWFDTKRAVFHNFGGFPYGPAGSHAEDLVGYETFGRVEGWVSVEGQRFEIDTETHRGSRDHHWGTRDGVGGPGHARNGIGQNNPAGHMWVEFKDWAIWGNRVLYNLGDPRPGTTRILRTDRQLRFDPDSHLFTGGVITVFLENSEKKVLQWRRLGSQVAYLRCGMYGGRQGGTPDGNIWHGMYVGENVVAGGVHDATKPDVQAALAGLDDHHCEVICDGETTYGIFEPYEPVCWEACRDGRPGYRVLE